MVIICKFFIKAIRYFTYLYSLGSVYFLKTSSYLGGETPQEALKREIQEELDTEISVNGLIETIEYDYPTFHLSMDCFWCDIITGDLVLKEHEAGRWLKKDELDFVEWLPADVMLINRIRTCL